jgi:hypothetical protein
MGLDSITLPKTISANGAINMEPSFLIGVELKLMILSDASLAI